MTIVRRLVMAVAVTATPVLADPVVPAALPAAPFGGPATAPSGAPQTVRSIADFATLPFMVGPELSPDGTRIAAKIAIAGRQALAIFALGAEKKPPVLIGLGEVDLTSWDWVNDDWLAITVGRVDGVEGQSIYLSRVIGVKADGSVMKATTLGAGGQSASMIWRAKDGSPRILLAAQKSLYLGDNYWPVVGEVDLPTGHSRVIVSGQEGVMNWYADPSGAVRMGIGYDDQKRTSRLLYRSTGSGPFRTVDRARRGDKEGLTVPILFANSTASPLTIAAPDGFDALHELDMNTLGVGKRVFGIDGYDIDTVRLTPDGAALAGVGYTSDRYHDHWVDPKMAELQAVLDKAVAPRSASIVSLSRDQQRMIVAVGNANQPGSFYVFDTADGRMQRFAYVNDALKGARLGPVTTFRYKTRDGLSIEAILTLPSGRAAHDLPLILMPHGGPEARDTADYDWWAQFLASRGYAVVQPNYRGSTGYGSALLKAGDGQWGQKMHDDLNDAVDALVAKGTVDAKRVAIVGASYGGYAALRGAQRDGQRYRCAISYAGVSDLNGMIRYDGRFLNANASRANWKESAPDLKAVSPINGAAEFSTPILIMHGKKDLRVPVSQSRRMVDRLKAAGKTVDYIAQPEGDHHFTRQADRVQFLESIERFLAKYNPA